MDECCRPFKRKREGDSDADIPAVGHMAPASKPTALAGKAASQLRPSDIPAGAEDTATASAECPDVSMVRTLFHGPYISCFKLIFTRSTKYSKDKTI